MFLKFIRNAAGAVLIAGMILMAPVFAGTAKADVKIAVVDIQRLMTQSKAAQSIQKQLETRRSEFQEGFSKQEGELRDIEKKLVATPEKDRTSEDFMKKKAEFEKKVAEARQSVQKRRAALEKGAAGAVAALQKEITKVVAKITTKEKYDLVLTRQDVIMAVDTMDITAAVLKDLDASVSKIDLKVDTN